MRGAGTFAAITRSLTRRAHALALARAEMRLRALRQDTGRWRTARLLWPQFTDRSL